MPSCPFCLSNAVLQTLPVTERSKGTRNIFHFAICRDCGSTYITDLPENISSYYEGYYSFEESEPTLDKFWWKRTVVSIYAKLVVGGGLGLLFRPLFRCPPPLLMKRITPNLQAFLFIGAKARARILDVGSGRGEFVEMMNRFGYDSASGIDPFLDESSERPHVRRGDVHSVKGTYDVILFNHSFEHLTDPEAAVKRCADLVSPRGIVVIHLPSIHSREFVKFKQDWWGLHAPYHVSLPSREGIELLAARCGFKVVDTICTSRFDHYLYSEDYSRDIEDRSPNSVRRKLESGTFDKQRQSSLSKLACTLNKTLAGDWVAYYLVRK